MPRVEIQFCIRGLHVYKEVLTPVIEEILICSRESANLHDPFAVKILKSEMIIGHLPRSISSVCSLFFRKGRLYRRQRTIGDSVDTDVYLCFFF